MRIEENEANLYLNRTPIRVLVVQQINRAYRVPLLKRLSEQPDIKLTMIHGTNPPVQAGDAGISIAGDSLPFSTISGPISGIRWKGRPSSCQPPLAREGHPPLPHKRRVSCTYPIAGSAGPHRRARGYRARSRGRRLSPARIRRYFPNTSRPT